LGFLDIFLNTDVLWRALPMLLRGLWNTVLLGVSTIVLGTILGVLVCLVRLYAWVPFRLLAVLYIDIVRALPALVLLILIYFALPFAGVLLDPFPAALLALCLAMGAYTAEVVRAGIQAVPRGQFEASAALGLSFWTTLSRVVLPQALRLVVPPHVSNCVSVVKDTALATVVTMPELMRQAQDAQALFANPTPLIGAALIYVILLWPLVRFTAGSRPAPCAPRPDKGVSMSDGSSYFLYHSIGQYPGKPDDLSRAMAEFGEVWGACDDGQWAYALGKRASFLERWRAILNAPEGSVTTCESVTQGFHALLTALPERYLRGRRVLVAADAFPSNHFLLQGLEARLGFTLATVPLRQGASWVEPEDFLDRWRPDVGIALLTWVSSTSSHRLDLAPLVAHGRAMGSLVGVDVTQAAGLLPYDAQDPAVDFTISTSLKWMCGTPGAGILHVTPALVTECEPEVRGWFSQDDPFNWDITRFSFATDARRFDSGTPAIVSAVASLPALDWHAGQDRARLLAHNRGSRTASSWPPRTCG
jgi:His/Glu/Gln/Arg/opine family amino acid ABC transporter permease subunit